MIATNYTYTFIEEPLEIKKKSIVSNEDMYVVYCGNIYCDQDLESYAVIIYIVFEEDGKRKFHTMPALESLAMRDREDTANSAKKYVENKIEEYKLTSKEEFERLANSYESIKKYHL